MTNDSTPKIFISYRRADSADICGRIYDRLVEHFGDEAVFKDVDDSSSLTSMHPIPTHLLGSRGVDPGRPC